jgi:hypothetical protein
VNDNRICAGGEDDEQVPVADSTGETKPTGILWHLTFARANTTYTKTTRIEPVRCLQIGK